MEKQIVSMKRGAQQGFTLIELMIVVTIIGVLAAFAIPMFQDYTVRTRVGEGLALASAYKNLVVDNAINGMGSTIGETEYNFGESTFLQTTNTESISIEKDSGVITIKSDTNKANGIVLILTPSAQKIVAGVVQAAESALTKDFGIPGGRISWKCAAGSTAVKASQIPSECRS